MYRLYEIESTSYFFFFLIKRQRFFFRAMIVDSTRSSFKIQSTRISIKRAEGKIAWSLVVYRCFRESTITPESSKRCCLRFTQLTYHRLGNSRRHRYLSWSLEISSLGLDSFYFWNWTSKILQCPKAVSYPKIIREVDCAWLINLNHTSVVLALIETKFTFTR